jgi:uncharacterized protein (DUF2342 family)
VQIAHYGTARQRTRAGGQRLEHSVALAEAISRRRASGGAAERTFAPLVRLELRTRILRGAAARWEGVTEARSRRTGRDMGHPDLLPTSDHLENPEARFLRGSTDLDIEISDFEDGGDESDGGGEEA